MIQDDRAAPATTISRMTEVLSMYTHQRIFDANSQAEFARISGDYNPIHMDAVTARRTSAGAPIVHGVHALLWLLDCVARSAAAVSWTGVLKAHFLQPIYLGDEVCAEIVEGASNGMRALLRVGTTEVLSASIKNVPPDRHDHPLPMPDFRPTLVPSSPQALRVDQIKGVNGCLPLAPADAQIGQLVPAAVRAFGARRAASLALTSCVVGMIVPGLHSIFTGLELYFCEDSSDTVQYGVISVNERFRAVRIGMRGSGLRGTLETISRPPPVQQAGFAQIMSAVSPEEFKNSTALVIGGSRGLGELTAKILAAGGSRVAITYASGREDAQAVADEICQAGGMCTALSHDVREPIGRQLAQIDPKPTHLYYFATPAISRRKSGLFDSHRFAEFNLFYSSAFWELVEICAQAAPTGLRAFYPSSSFVESRPPHMTEYAMAKAAAEVLCADLSRYVRGVRVFTHRLPRLPTDQTASVMSEACADALSVMLPIVREMHQTQ